MRIEPLELERLAVRVVPRATNSPDSATAVAMFMARANKAEQGLELLQRLDSDKHLARHYRLDAVRAHLYEMAGDSQAARLHYLAAAGRTTSLPERNYLLTRAARLESTNKGRRI